MASWDGGILDSIRSIGDDVSGFFDTTLGKGLTSAFAQGNAKSEVKTRRTNEINTMGYAPADLTRETDYNLSEDFSRIEAEWLERLKKFAGLNEMVKDSEVRLG
jgi:hypothetical protein